MLIDASRFSIYVCHSHSTVTAPSSSKANSPGCLVGGNHGEAGRAANHCATACLALLGWRGYRGQEKVRASQGSNGRKLLLDVRFCFPLPPPSSYRPGATGAYAW